MHCTWNCFASCCFGIALHHLALPCDALHFLAWFCLELHLCCSGLHCSGVATLGIALLGLQLTGLHHFDLRALNALVPLQLYLFALQLRVLADVW